MPNVTGLNISVLTRVLTTSGIKYDKDLIPGDELIEYGSNRTLVVRDVHIQGPHDIWEFQYTDGRRQYVNVRHKIFNGANIISPISVMTSGYSNIDILKQYPIRFAENVKGKLEPDPYVAGALIVYGDHNDEFINLPIDMDKANSHIAHKYGLDYASKLGKNKAYFCWEGYPDGEAITWKEFFGDIHIKKGYIPNKYRFTSLKDRVHFIQGVFDCGYDHTVFPNSTGIVGENEEMLKQVQWMLWSIGVNSVVEYDPWVNKANREYKLRILTPHENWPDFFYDISNIERCCVNDNMIIWKERPFKLEITGAKKFCRGYTYAPIFDKPEALYLDENFLPKVSM